MTQSLRGADIVGHSDIAPGRKTDPGSAFDWLALERQLVTPHQLQRALQLQIKLAVPPGARKPLGLYLIEAGIVPEEELETYGSDGSRLPMSGMAAYTPGMEMSGGSIGLGLPTTRR